MIECLSLQHAHQLYKEEKLSRLILEAICKVYLEEGATAPEISDAVIEHLVATKCKAEDLFMSFGGGNLYIAESAADIEDFANTLLGARYTSVDYAINFAEFAIISKDTNQVCAFYATNNAGGPLLVTDAQYWKDAGGHIEYAD
jgi:hypothetical protein